MVARSCPLPFAFVRIISLSLMTVCGRSCSSVVICGRVLLLAFVRGRALVAMLVTSDAVGIYVDVEVRAIS